MASHYYHNDNLWHKTQKKKKKEKHTQAMLGIKSHHHHQHQLTYGKYGY